MISTEKKVGSTEVKEIMTIQTADGIRAQAQLPDLRQKYEMEVRQSGEIDSLTSEICVQDLNTILNFGKEPAEEMANVADMVMQNYNATLSSDSSKLIDNLLGILEKIDCKELENIDQLIEKRKANKKSFFDRFKESLEDVLNKAVGRYQGIGKELENVVAELQAYNNQIDQSNADIKKMYDASINHFKRLTAYVLAAEEAVKEIEVYRDNVQNEFDKTGDPDKQFELSNANNALALMQKRALALQGAEALALQSIPTFRVQEVTNANLSATINETFIITIPAFKNALVNSVIAKQQSIMAQGLAAVNEVNSRVIRKNAENVGKQLLISQQLMQTTAVKPEDIEYSMNVLLSAAKQYKEREKQMIETSKLEQQKIKDMENRYLVAVKNNETL